jgi:hypothetical protein
MTSLIGKLGLLYSLMWVNAQDLISFFDEQWLIYTRHDAISYVTGTP